MWITSLPEFVIEVKMWVINDYDACDVNHPTLIMGLCRTLIRLILPNCVPAVQLAVGQPRYGQPRVTLYKTAWLIAGRPTVCHVRPSALRQRERGGGKGTGRGRGVDRNVPYVLLFTCKL